MRCFIGYPLGMDESPDSDESFDEFPEGNLQGGNENDLVISSDDAGSDANEEHVNTNEGNEESNEAVSSDEEEIEEEEHNDGNSNEENIDDGDSDASSEAEATMEDIFGVKPATKSQHDQPPDITTDSGVVDVQFHPQCELLAVATLDGEVIMYRYNTETTQEETRFSHHTKSCRCVRFNEDGSFMISVSKDKSMALVDAQNSCVKYHIKDAHESGIYSALYINENLCATGDDDGFVKLWDLRKKSSVFDFKCGEMSVTGLLSDSDENTLVASVSDGSIAAFNIPGRKLKVQSEMYDSEFTSLALVENDTRLVVGAGDGSLFFYKWGEFGYHYNKFKVEPVPVSCILPVNNTITLVGHEDGKIRALSFFPHRIIGIIGQHDGSGVENMSLSCDERFIASCCMDEVVSFWNIDFLDEAAAMEDRRVKPKAGRNRNLLSSRVQNASDFYSDFPAHVESDDDTGGPVPGPSNMND